MGTPEQLIDAAIESVGADDFGGTTWREGLDRYVDSLGRSAQLNEIGVGVARDGVVGDLSTRLRLVRWRREHPAVAEQQVLRPIIIVGLRGPAPRSCTTCWRRTPRCGRR